MKKIFCELCDGTDFSKENGMFVCQGCGTKYTAEEARALMREVEGGSSAPAIASTSAAPVPMGNPNQAQIDNLLLLATNAYDASNLAEAEGYCNKIIELDATCYKAWLLKGKTMGWRSSLSNDRVQESAFSFCKAIDFAPDDEKDDVKNEVVNELKIIGLALIKMCKEKFSTNPSKENLDNFGKEAEILINALITILKHGHSIEKPKDYFAAIAKEMNLAAVAGLNKSRDAWYAKDYPQKRDLDIFIGQLTNIEDLLRVAINASDDDDEEDIRRYKNLKVVINAPMLAIAYTKEIIGGKICWIPNVSLTEGAKAARKKQIQECDNAIAAIEKKIKEKKADEARKAEEEKKARINAYWEAHAEEKTALENEKQQLAERSKTLSKEIAELDKQINAAMSQVDGLKLGIGPAEEESDALRGQVKYLESRRAQLGVFAGKEKKQITADIAALQARIDSLRGNVEQEQLSARADIANKKAEIVNSIKPQRDKKKALEDEYSKVNNRIKEIDNELNNPKMDE